jgi:hypothetical protein
LSISPVSGGKAVAVGGSGVAVGGTGVAVGGSGVAVGSAWVGVLHAVRIIMASTTKIDRMVFIFSFSNEYSFLKKIPQAW